MLSTAVCTACREKVGWIPVNAVRLKEEETWYCPHMDKIVIVGINDVPPSGCIHKLEHAVAAGMKQD